GGSSVKVLDHVNSTITFSPDGKQFAFVRHNQEDMVLMVANTDGSGQPRSIALRKQPDFFSTEGPPWSSDGKRIACGAGRRRGAASASVCGGAAWGRTPRDHGRWEDAV